MSKLETRLYRIAEFLKSEKILRTHIENDNTLLIETEKHIITLNLKGYAFLEFSSKI